MTAEADIDVTRPDPSRIADEQAALRRIAVRVAEGAPAAGVFAEVVQAVVGVLDVEAVAMFRCTPERTGTVVAGVGSAAFVVGSQWSLEGTSVSATIFDTGRPARIEDYSSLPGEIAESVRTSGFHSTLGVPIMLDGAVWGAIIVASLEPRPFPPDTEARLAGFTELVATAIANTESRDRLRGLAEEQAALRRVATLVAAGAPAAELIGAVAQEVSHVFDLPRVAISRYEPDSSILVLAGGREPLLPVGSRWPLDGPSNSATILETGRPARRDGFEGLSGTMAEYARTQGFYSAAGSPIVVDGKVWGLISVATTGPEPLPPGIEIRLNDFTELVATAISNADSREELKRLADEQAALRHVATLVAQGGAASALFDAVAEEVAAVVGVSSASVSRFLPDGSSVVLASHKDPGFPVGSRWQPDEGTLNALILGTGRPVRIDQSEMSGPIADASRLSNVGSVVGVPIVVEGGVWGMVAVGHQHSDEPLPPETEARLAGFTELIATAISNTESREGLRLLADEQAALHRVAALVAHSSPPAEIFAAVSEEVARLLDLPFTEMVRYEGDTGLVIGASGDHPFPVGSRWPLDAPSVMAAVHRSGRPERIHDFGELPGVIAEVARDAGITSAIGAPIVVEDATWGVIIAISTTPEPIADDAEQRLSEFTDLVATAIANVEAADELHELADEQGALRRVATLVAREASSADLFRAVTEEAARVLETEAVGLLRFESDGTATLVAQSETPWDPPPLGTRFTLEGKNILSHVLRTRQTVRVDDWATSTGSVVAMADTLGVRSSVATPIVVAGQLWGALVAVTSQTAPLPADTEVRIAGFSELVATAIGNAESREAVAQLVDEQAALRRVATLVAQAVPPAELVLAVTKEVAHVFSAEEPSILASVIRFDPGPECVLVGASRPYEGEPIGSRWVPKELYVSTRVLRTGRSARVNASDLEALEGPDAEALRLRGFLHQVGSPVVVEGRLWGAMTLNSRDELPPDTDQRLERFTELIGTAIANAEAGDALARLADEQAALRRVATLVARDAPSTEVFESVATEVGKLLDTDITVLGRYDDDGAATAIGSWSASPGGVPVGTRSTLGGRNVLTIVAETGKPARVDGYDDATGEAAEIARRHGWRSSIAAPIVVEGRLWGVMLVAAQRLEPFPAGAEERLAAFTDLVATAVANAESKAELAASEAHAHELAGEQAALRRVATLVAEGTSADELFSAVAREVAELPGVELAAMSRLEPDAARTLVAAWGDPELARRVGSRWPLEESPSTSRILATGRPLRVDLAADQVRHGPATGLGVRSYVGSPIEVEGRMWGALFAMARRELPADTERRLTNFTELVATAISNAEARDGLKRLADEQAALRRVATLVAEGAPAEELFSAVAGEVRQVLGVSGVVLDRYDPAGKAITTLALELEPGWTTGSRGLFVGAHFPLEPGSLCAAVWETGKAARINDYSDLVGVNGDAARKSEIGSSCGTPIVVDGKLWGTMSAFSRLGMTLPAGTEQRLQEFTEILATALSNIDARDEQRRLAEELIASRKRIIAAGDEARRRIERNLHDGTQQRLIALGFDLQRVRATLPADQPGAWIGLERVEQDLESLLEEVQELSRGLHPPLLSRRGLGPSLAALARRSPIPVGVEVDLPERPREAIEIAAYYVVSEALTNAIKYSEASSISVTVGSDGERLHATIADDGVGGAEPGLGSGLIGLVDRVDALGGRLDLDSPPGDGTTISIELPLGASATV